MFSTKNFHRQLPPVFLALLLLGHATLALAAVTITSTTHPYSVTESFQGPGVPFTAYAVPGGVPSGARFQAADGVLAITNQYPGSFGIDTKLKAFDAEHYSDLSFDYRLAPQVKINIFFRLNGKYHGVLFSGPRSVRPGSVLLGALGDVRADGQWHQAHIPLRDWLRKLYPLDPQLNVDEVIIGNWDNAGYLMAGIGGNGAGAQWSMRNFALTGVGPSSASFSFSEEPGGAVRPGAYQWSLDAGELHALTAANLQLKPADGLHLLQVLDGKGKALAAYAFRISSSGPHIGEPVLEGNVVKVPVVAAAGLDLRGLNLKLGARQFTAASPELVYDGHLGILALDVAALPARDGEKWQVTLEGVKDVLGRDAPTKSAAVTVDYAQHTQPPPPPAVAALTGKLGNGSFETGLDEWAGDGPGGAIVERDAGSAASGNFSLRLTSPAPAATMRTWVRQTPYDAAAYPVISFDYRVSSLIRSDFLVGFQGKTYSVHWTDSDSTYQRIGEVADVTPDEKWHHAEIDLEQMLRKAAPAAAPLTVDWIAMSDTGWLGNGRGVQYWVDNFHFVPRLKSPLACEATLKDISGAANVSWLLDESPETVPPAVAQSGPAFSVNGSKGRHWLHVRARDGAGVWSPAAHFELMFD